MLPLWFVIGFLFCAGSCAEDDSNLDQNQWNDIMDELKILRKEVEENRKRIVQQEGELKAVKLELEETKRHCHSEPNPTEKKSKPEEVDVFSRGKHSINRSRGLSKIRRIIPPTSPTNSHDGPIAFYAYMNAPMTNIGGHHILLFDVIKSNLGFGLHPTAGVFTAPKSGIYVFTWTIRVYDHGVHSVELVVNGQVVGALFPHSGAGDNDTGSTIAVVSVNEGEDVYLRTRIDNNAGVIYSDANGYSSFAGWKLT